MIKQTDTKSKIDLLLVNASLDFEKDKKKLEALKVESQIARQISPPLGIAYLLAKSKQDGIRAKYIDMVAYETSVESLLHFIGDYQPSVIGFTAYTTQINDAGAVAETIKKDFPRILIGVGGAHATADPLRTLEEFHGFDFCVLGEGENILPRIFRDLSLESLSAIEGVVTRGKSDTSLVRINDLDALPFPAWEEFDLARYPGSDPHRTKLELPISTSRGCPNNCIFCLRLFGRKRIHRTVGSVIREIEHDISQHGCEALYFTDETFIAKMEWSRELFETMIDRGINKKIKWSCETRVDIASPELFQLMKKAGCYYIFFGFESADDAILKESRKGFKVSQIKKAIGYAKDAGIVCAGSFIIGLPGETELTARKTMEFAHDLDIYSTTFPIAVPFPGTVIRKMAEKHEYGLRILSDKWSDYGKQYPGVMESEHLKIDELRKIQREAYDLNPKKNIENYDKS